MKKGRRIVELWEVRRYAAECGVEDVDSLGIMALVDVENMGWCKDGVSRWYTFDLDGEPCIYFKH